VPNADNQIVMKKDTHGIRERTHGIREWFLGKHLEIGGKGCRFVRGKHQTRKTTFMKKSDSKVNKENDYAKKNEYNKMVDALHSAEVNPSITGISHWTVVGSKNIPKALKEKGQFITLFQEFGNKWIESIQYQRENRNEKFICPISPDASHVFLFFLMTMNWGNWVYLSKKEVSEFCALGKNQVRTSRAINELLELDLIQAHKTAENSNVIHYRVNIQAGWKGSTTSWKNENEASKEGNIRLDWKTAKSIQQQETKRSEKGWDSLRNRKSNE
jgi:hypothetical protein